MANSVAWRAPGQHLVHTEASDPTYQAYQLLHIGFTVAPIIAGLDKFFHYLVDWNQYLSPLVSRYIEANQFMSAVGVIEIIAGLLVAIKPKVGAWIVGVWLLGIVINLLTMQRYYDIALRDFGLALGAFALARLAATFDRPREESRVEA